MPHLNHGQIVCMPKAQLRIIVRGTNPRGSFAQEVRWAQMELDRRFPDVHPNDINPATNRPYSNYSSPSLDAYFTDDEEDDDAEDGELEDE